MVPYQDMGFPHFTACGVLFFLAAEDWLSLSLNGCFHSAEGSLDRFQRTQ